MLKYPLSIAYMRLLDTILALIFPAKCAACGKTGTDLCRECLLGYPNAERESAKWIFPLYDYRHPALKKSLWLFKYNGKQRLAKVFAEVLYDKILEELADLYTLQNFRNPLLVPIPLSRARLRERGYNQSGLICLELMMVDAARRGASFELAEKILVKSKDNEHQARIKDRQKRLANMRGTFAAINKEKIKSRNIILIDDILTTGATLGEARRVLRAAGARKVIAFTVAH